MSNQEYTRVHLTTISDILAYYNATIELYGQLHDSVQDLLGKYEDLSSNYDELFNSVLKNASDETQIIRFYDDSDNISLYDIERDDENPVIVVLQEDDSEYDYIYLKYVEYNEINDTTKLEIVSKVDNDINFDVNKVKDIIKKYDVIYVQDLSIAPTGENETYTDSEKADIADNSNYHTITTIGFNYVLIYGKIPEYYGSMVDENGEINVDIEGNPLGIFKEKVVVSLLWRNFNINRNTIFCEVLGDARQYLNNNTNLSTNKQYLELQNHRITNDSLISDNIGNGNGINDVKYVNLTNIIPIFLPKSTLRYRVTARVANYTDSQTLDLDETDETEDDHFTKIRIIRVFSVGTDTIEKTDNFIDLPHRATDDQPAWNTNLNTNRIDSWYVST